MLPVLAHYCEHCQYNTPVLYTVAVFSENHRCNHCGSVSSGLRLRENAEEKKQVVDMQQDELANLFSRQLNFSNPTPPPEEHQQNQQQVVVEKIHDPQPVAYASQHYTQTHHVVPVRFHTPPQPSVPPSQQAQQQLPEQHLPSDEELWQMLVSNWIDPALLFPSQVELLRNADADQRLRLLELWRISPPNNEAYDFPSEQASWAETDLQKEEALAKMRYEHRMASRSNENMMADAAPPAPEPERPSTAPPDSKTAAEPYMMSGYEMLSRREYETQAQQQQPQAAQPLQETTRYNQATDPVFKGASPSSVITGLWSKVDVVQDMENAYGNFEAQREMEAGGMAARNGLDDEMIM